MKVVIDGVTIDDETGEIIDCKGDALAWAVATYQNAKLNITGWEQTKAIAKQAMNRLLDEAGERRIKTDYGTAGIRAGKEMVDAKAMQAAIHSAELTATERLEFFANCASGFTPSKTKGWLTMHGMGALIPDVLRHGSDYIQVDPPKGLPPKIEPAS